MRSNDSHSLGVHKSQAPALSPPNLLRVPRQVSLAEIRLSAPVMDGTRFHTYVPARCEKVAVLHTGCHICGNKRVEVYFRVPHRYYRPAEYETGCRIR